MCCSRVRLPERVVYHDRSQSRAVLLYKTHCVIDRVPAESKERQRCSSFEWSHWSTAHPRKPSLPSGLRVNPRECARVIIMVAMNKSAGKARGHDIRDTAACRAQIALAVVCCASTQLVSLRPIWVSLGDGAVLPSEAVASVHHLKQCESIVSVSQCDLESECAGDSLQMNLLWPH
jgi:hypothetical protein